MGDNTNNGACINNIAAGMFATLIAVMLHMLNKRNNHP